MTLNTRLAGLMYPIDICLKSQFSLRWTINNL